MEEKFTTVIVNETDHDLIMKVGNRDCFVPLAVVKKSCPHAIKLCMNWTFQEFMLEAKNLNDVVGKRLFVNSDDCCDYERITVKESDGKFVVDRVPRKAQINAEGQAAPRQGILSWLPSWISGWFFGALNRGKQTNMTSYFKVISWILSMDVVASLMASVAAARDFTALTPVPSLDVTAVITEQDGVALQWFKITIVPLGVFLMGAFTWRCIKNSVVWRNWRGPQGEPDATGEQPIVSGGDPSDVEGGSLELSHLHADDVASTSGAQVLEVQRGPPFESSDHEEKSVAADDVPQL